MVLHAMHTWVLRELIDLGAMPVSIIFEKSCRMGDMHDWRKANVSPVFKKGKKEDPENYWPASPPSLER